MTLYKKALSLAKNTQASQLRLHKGCLRKAFLTVAYLCGITSLNVSGEEVGAGGVGVGGCSLVCVSVCECQQR